jgi:tetratricopeptide (TPR) repeat protein
VHAPSSTSDERIEALRTKAELLHRDRRFAEEAEAWSEICQIQPDNALWLHNLALALLHCDRLDECLPLFVRLLQEAPTLSRVHNIFAMAALRLGVPPKFLISHFIQALELSQDDDEFYRHLINSCNSIVYGFDDQTESEAVLDLLGDRVVGLIEERSEPKYRYRTETT